VGDRDQPGARPDRALERGHVHLAKGVVVDDVDLDADPMIHLEIGQVVRHILGAGGDDAVSGAKGDRVECHVPRARRVLDERDLVGVGADQGRDGGIHVCHRAGRLGRGLVSADQRFALQVAGHRVEDRARRQRRSGFVEVEHVIDAGRVGSQASNVHRRLSSGILRAGFWDAGPGRSSARRVELIDLVELVRP